ncbi:hypothetical protein CAI21_09290 [Alkalilimnicola ehrlichii]|nr:hypothetical protein CAI21_09290 [Alkalilimnicola ehrlichii]
MRQQGREGVVRLEVLIDHRGQVVQVTVSESAGEAFDQAAIAAMRASSFSPGRMDDKPVPVLMRIPVSFKLR